MLTHLVLSGGGANCIAHLGILQEIEKREPLTSLHTFYCTSAGTAICVLLAMHIPLAEIVEYFLDRPWDKWIQFDKDALPNGFCSSSILSEGIVPFFNAHDVPLDITLQGFRDRFQTDLHLFATELKTLTSVEFCAASHPDVAVLDAATLGSLLPPVFAPVKYRGSYYLDGGIATNFPVLACLQTTSPDTMITVNNCFSRELTDDPPSAMGVLAHILAAYFYVFNRDDDNVAASKSCKYNFAYPADSIFGAELWSLFLTSRETREVIFKKGIQCANTTFSEAAHC